MKFAFVLPAAASILALSACGDATDTAEAPPAEAMPTQTAPAKMAKAVLMDRNGEQVGTVEATGSDGAIEIVLNATGMPEGEHGAHIHTTGDCSAPDFTSAGGHWNPGGTNHGTMSEGPNPHAGDMPNLTVGADGTGMLEATSTGTFAGLMDADGSAFVIHAKPDDYKSQPSGDAGERIACGVFTTEG